MKKQKNKQRTKKHRKEKIKTKQKINVIPNTTGPAHMLRGGYAELCRLRGTRSIGFPHAWVGVTVRPKWFVTSCAAFRTSDFFLLSFSLFHFLFLFYFLSLFLVFLYHFIFLFCCFFFSFFILFSFFIFLIFCNTIILFFGTLKHFLKIVDFFMNPWTLLFPV